MSAIARTFVTYLLVYIYNRTKIAHYIAAKIESAKLALSGILGSKARDWSRLSVRESANKITTNWLAVIGGQGVS